jgi:hypothetical protein
VDDLVAFLRACLDDDERVARAAAYAVADHCYPSADAEQYAERSGVWLAQPHLFHRRVVADAEPGWRPRVIESTWTEAADHIARHDPARVLAEVAAKRAVVDMGHALLDTQPNDPAAALMMTQAGDHVLRHLAAIYADHPDYRQEWRP